MNKLQAMRDEAKRLGCQHGESAATWRLRDPKAAEAMAQWIKENMAEVTQQIAAIIQPR